MGWLVASGSEALTPAPPPVQGDNTALHWASMRGHVEIVKFLMQVRAGALASRAGVGSAAHPVRAHPGRAGAPPLSTPPLPPRMCQSGADRGLRNKQDKLPVDLCQPCWSNSYRFTREVLAG